MTKWKIKRLDDVDGKINFSWDKADSSKGSKWDWEKIHSEVNKMEIGEERIVEIL